MIQNKKYMTKKYQNAGKANINDNIYHSYPGIRVPAFKPDNSKKSINVLPVQNGLPQVNLPEFEIKDKRVENKSIYNNDGTMNMLSLTNPNVINNYNSSQKINTNKYSWLNKIESRRPIDQEFNYNPNKPVEVKQAKPIEISDLKEYEKRKRAYEDSLELHLKSKRPYDYINMSELEHSKQANYDRAVGEYDWRNTTNITPYDKAMAATEKGLMSWEEGQKFRNEGRFKINWIKNTTGAAMNSPMIGDGVKNKDGVIFKETMPYILIDSNKGESTKGIEMDSNPGAIFPPPKQKVIFKPKKEEIISPQPPVINEQKPIIPIIKKDTVPKTYVSPKPSYYPTQRKDSYPMSEKEEKEINERMYEQIKKPKRYFGGIAQSRKFQTGGQINDLQMKGYKSDSPYKHLNNIKIDSDTIDTNNMAYPALLLVNDKGQKQIVYNNSGNITMNGSKYIVEYPIRNESELNYYKKQLNN